MARIDLPMRKLPIDFEAIRTAFPIASIASNLPGFCRAGHEYKACCPFHAEKTPSFTIFAGGQKFHCFGCGAHGDVVDYVRLIDGVDYREAAERLVAGLVPSAPVQLLPPAEEKRTQGEAERIWQNAVSASQTPVSAYLASRGLNCSIPPSIRFARLPYGRGAAAMPCMVALVVDADGSPTGIQRTYLQEDGRGKADVAKPKLCLGRIGGGAVRLGEPERKLIVTGGIEDGLTLQQGVGQPAWAVTGEAMIAGLQLPDAVQSVVIGADADKSGREAANRGAISFTEQGREARIIYPSAGFKDFNQELQERGSV